MYDTQMGAQSQISILELVSDPSVKRKEQIR